MADKIYVTKAIQLENNKSIFEIVMPTLTHQRYERIGELYVRAGNVCKLTEKPLAINRYESALKFYVCIPNSESTLALIQKNIAELYEDIDYTKAIEYYKLVIDYYLNQGDLYMMAKTYETIAELFFKHHKIHHSIETYRTVIQIINGCNLEIQTHIKRRCYEKLSELLIDTNRFAEAIDIYMELFDIATMTSSKRKYAVLCILTCCACSDFVKATNNFVKYSEIDGSFEASSEGRFIKQILYAIDVNNCDKLVDACHERDLIHGLDNIQTKLLSKIKEIVKGFGINDLEDEDANIC